MLEQRSVPVRKTMISAALLLVSLPGAFAASSKSSSGNLVIVFKDGHRQTFNLSEIERVEFPASGSASGASASTDTPSNGQMPVPRGRFVGKWEAGDGNGGTFYITLNENGTAHRSINNIYGKWVYSNGEALITWNDGAKDALRKVGNKFQKFAYEAGKSFTDVPANVADAHNTSPRPI
jgi:hypothetical protein